MSEINWTVGTFRGEPRWVGILKGSVEKQDPAYDFQIGSSAMDQTFGGFGWRLDSPYVAPVQVLFIDEESLEAAKAVCQAYIDNISGETSV